MEISVNVMVNLLLQTHCILCKGPHLHYHKVVLHMVTFEWGWL